MQRRSGPSAEAGEAAGWGVRGRAWGQDPWSGEAALDELADARVLEFVPIFAWRHARQLLRTAA